ncbi:MAG: glycosyltransferase [Opitutales bacterium]|nr:glycosyltransferase [Opitutales bacterium]NRA28218.1 glycosyltransferase [Opitutales bacterium]
MISQRIVISTITVALIIVGTLGYSLITDSFDTASLIRVFLPILLGASGLALPFVWPRFRTQRIEVSILLLLALSLRLCFLPAAASDDVYRYIWEGNLLQKGISPYLGVADDPIYADYRDENWEQMNNRDKLTAYPPLSIATFTLVNQFSPTPLGFKIAMVAVDLAICALILLWLHRRRRPLRWSLFYLANPVTLIAFSGEAHFDALMVLSLVIGIMAAERRRWWIAGIAIGCAVQFKIIALLLVPFLFLRGGVRPVFAVGAAATIPLLFFISDLPNLAQGILGFGAERSFNGLIHDLLHDFLNNRDWANQIVGVCLLVVLAYRFFLRPKSSIDQQWLWACGALLVLSPTFHFWYLTWILPVVAVRVSLPWLALCVSQGLYFIVWIHFAEGAPWDLHRIETTLLWSPLFIGFLMITWARSHWAKKKASIIKRQDKPHGISVVIPTLNAASTLKAAITSVSQSQRPPDEIIVCDADSHDATRAIAKELGANVISTPQGRGNQIAAGIQASRFNSIVILHADCQLPANALTGVERTFTLNTEIDGGCLGQRFNDQRPALLCVEALNELRASGMGIAFGDQVQFLHQSRLQNPYPAQPLMEDIELSLGFENPVYLGHEATVSATKWTPDKSQPRFIKVLSLVARYHLVRCFGAQRAQKYSERLYQEYYS